MTADPERHCRPFGQVANTRKLLVATFHVMATFATRRTLALGETFKHIQLVVLYDTLNPLRHPSNANPPAKFTSHTVHVLGLGVRTGNAAPHVHVEHSCLQRLRAPT